MKALLQQWTPLKLQNIAMSKTEFPFEKLASVWLQVSSFTSFTTFAFICGFVVTPLWVRREVLQWIQELYTKFIRKEIANYLYFDQFF